jgi:hypothetical protein
MSHILAKLRKVKPADIRKQLKKDADQHAEQGLYLEHLWQNADNQDEVYFLFRADNLERSRAFINKTHSEARKENPEAVLPEMLYLKD